MSARDYFTEIPPFEYKRQMLSAKLVGAGPALSNDRNALTVQRPDRWHGYVGGTTLAQWDWKESETADDVRMRLRAEAEAAILNR